MSTVSKPAPKASFGERLKKQKYLQMMVWPGIIWMFIFNYIPMSGIIIAFKDYKITGTMWGAPWAGLSHFKEFLTDPSFMNIMQNTLGISLLKLCIAFPLPILFALLVNEVRSARYKKSIQTISYLPHFISWVVLGGLLITWLSDTGMINEVLVMTGILKEPIAFLADPKYFWWVAVISDTWKELGWSAIIYIAAISGIDQQMYEAAAIDGATKMQKIWHITLPAIKGTIAVMFILAVAGMLNSNFDQIFILNNVLNAEASEVIDTYVYKMGMRSGRYSYATAIGLFKSVVAMILLVIANFITKKLQGRSLF
ncbi:MAG: protein lplB [Epulopiscium sp. Nele67-Bin005]|nr:MAG: protein lplB [Epulopiscium sp. Nele67-Bin005]